MRKPPLNIEPKEHHIQKYFFHCLHADLCEKWPELWKTFAVPNGEHRHIRVAKRLKEEGVKPGVPDVCIPAARYPYHGLWLEFKTQSGRVEREQKAYHDHLDQEGYAVHVVRSAENALEIVKNYMELPKWEKDESCPSHKSEMPE